MTRRKKRSHTLLFIFLVLILVLAFYANLKRKKSVLDGELSPMALTWERIVAEKILEQDLGLTHLRDSRILSHRMYEYLYPRRHTPEGLTNGILKILEDRGVEVRKVTVGAKTRDVSFEIASDDNLFAELICTPDMSTSSGKICLIIDDFGYSLNGVVRDFLKLGVPATFSVLPGHTYSGQIAALAQQAGFEIMVHMPMESKGGHSGEEEFMLRRGQTRGEIQSRLRKAFLEIPQAKGVNNHQGSGATESRRMMRTVAEVLRAEGKYFVDSRTTAKSVAVAQMQREDVSVAVRHVFIDFEDEPDTVRHQLTLLASKARENRMAIGIAHPRGNTFEVLRQEIPRLRLEGFDFVYASAIVQ